MPKPSLREAFIDAGLTELQTQGYSATGVSCIAQRAGAPKGSFYNHFASKEDFAVEVLRRYAAGRRLEMLTDRSLAPLARIKAHFDYLQADLANDNYARGCMFGNFAAEVSGTNQKLADIIHTALDTWATLLAETINEAREADDVSPTVDPSSTAQLLIDAWEGATLRAKASANSAALDNVLAFAFTQLLTPTAKD
jgi:TetR/AcrR family transcriptional repressor of nem operon